MSQPTTPDEWKAYLTANAPLTVGVCGGRKYANGRRVYAVLDRLHRHYGIGRLFHGDATGADAWASVWRFEMSVWSSALGLAPSPFEQPYPANWRPNGKLDRSAGPRRNAEMLAAELAHGPVHLLVAFPGGRGTADMVRRAREAGVPVFEVPE